MVGASQAFRSGNQGVGHVDVKDDFASRRKRHVEHDLDHVQEIFNVNVRGQDSGGAQDAVPDSRFLDKPFGLDFCGRVRVGGRDKIIRPHRRRLGLGGSHHAGRGHLHQGCRVSLGLDRLQDIFDATYIHLPA